MSTQSAATFHIGGIHPPEGKEPTNKLQTEVMPIPEEIYLFLTQHIGAPCEPIVEKKAEVIEGDLIAQVKGSGANIHASVSGTVVGVKDVPDPTEGKSRALIIKTKLDAEPRVYPTSDWTKLSREEILERIARAGVVGLGGAGFPAATKLNLKPDVKIDTLILNGAECEPCVTSDHRLMVEHPRELVEGAKIILKILGINYCAIGIEENKPDAIEILNRTIAEDKDKNGYRIEVKPLEVKYPQGSADQIMYSITGRARPSGKRSSAIGIILQNVYTAKAIYDAVVHEKALYERIITVTGKGIRRPANLLVRIGTPISAIVKYLGGTTPDLAKIIDGGPMMGDAVSSLDVPVSKTTASLLFLTKDEVCDELHNSCIRCGFCLDACPMGLEPNNVSIYVEAGQAIHTEQFGVDDCFECGSCAYVCPSKRPLVQFIRLAKFRIAEDIKHKQLQKHHLRKAERL